MQKMTDAQRELVQENLPLVTWCLQNRIAYWKADEYDDLFQVGALGLCKAAIRYDERFGVQFGTFACECIFNEARNAMKTWRRQERRAGLSRLEEPVSIDAEEITLADTIPDKEDGLTMERMLILRETIGRIKGQDRRVIDLTVQGFGQVEVGRRLGISQPHVSMILRRSRKLIADEYAR